MTRIAVVALAAASLAAVAQTTPRVTLVHETRVTLKARVLVHEPGGGHSFSLGESSTTGGEAFPLQATIETRSGRIALDALVEARPDEATELCALRVEAAAQPASGDAVRVTRDARLAADRLLLVDVWSDTAGTTRIVLALSASWERVPSLTTLAAGGEPLDLVVEVLLGDGPGARLLERHRLGGLVGSPIRYTFSQLSGAAGATESAADPGELTIEVVPRSIEAGLALLRVTISHEGDSPYSDLGSLNVSLDERLPPGGTVSVPLPRGGDAAPLVFRLTPYF